MQYIGYILLALEWGLKLWVVIQLLKMGRNH